MNNARLAIPEVYKWWDVLRGGGQLTEIRLISNDGKTASGIFDDIETLIKCIVPFTNDWNIYYTINRLPDDVKGLPQYNKIIIKPKQTCNDNTIAVRDYVCIDLDSVRLSGTNATDEQIKHTQKKANELYKYLTDVGFYPPIVVFSGNGAHLYLKCAMLNTEKNRDIVKRFLNALAMMFTDEHTDVDCSVFNAGRIMRLPSTYSCKGNTTDLSRPQRLCKFVKIPNEIKVNDVEYFEKVANLYPEEEVKPNHSNGYSLERFDLESFISKHNIEITKKQKVAGGTKYLLKECIFNPDHKSPDSMIFQRDNGAISFFCYHNSCSHYTWKDVRLKFEPDAYSKKDYREFQFKQRYYSHTQAQPFTPVEETEDKGKKWLTSKDIKRKSESDIIAIPTGYSYLDKAIRGLILGEVTILSGLNGSGKSSWLNSVMLNVIQRGFKVACFSGELTDYNVMKWLAQSAAGKNYVHKVEGSEYAYDVEDRTYDKIMEWLYDKFYLFNNNYGNNFSQVISDLDEVVKKGAQLIIIDNLMALQISNLGGDKNEKQKQFILEVVEFAKKRNVHIVVVCHPRKESGAQTLLRKESIAGSSDLSNAVQNVAIVHRCGEDFCKRASEFFGKDKAEKYMEYSNVVEICKNRSYGIVDYLVGMYYEVETKRFKNYKSEHIVYNWQEENDTYYSSPQTEDDVMLTTFNNSPF